MAPIQKPTFLKSILRVNTSPTTEWAWVLGRIALVVTTSLGAWLFLRDTAAFLPIVGLLLLAVAYNGVLALWLLRGKHQQVFVVGLLLDTYTLLVGWWIGTRALGGQAQTNDLYLILFPVVALGVARLSWPLGIAYALFWAVWVTFATIAAFGPDTYDYQQLPVRILFLLVTAALTIRLVARLDHERRRVQVALTGAEMSNRRLNALYDAGQALGQAPTLPEAPVAAARAVVRHLGRGTAALVYLYSPDVNTFMLGAREGIDHEAARDINVVPGSITRAVFLAGGSQLVHVEHLPSEIASLTRGLSSLGFVTCALVPLRAQTDWLGLLVVCFKDRAVASEDMELLNGIGRQTAQAIFNAQLFESERHSRAVAERLIESLRADIRKEKPGGDVTGTPYR